jgi:hypothetical protein
MLDAGVIPVAAPDPAAVPKLAAVANPVAAA